MLNMYDVVLLGLIFVLIKYFPSNLAQNFKYNGYSFEIFKESLFR